MTPKEKAIELIAKHFQIVAKSAGHKGIKTSADTHVFGKLETLSIKLSILTVDEIIKEIEGCNTDYSVGQGFYQKVKHELSIFK